EQGHGAPGLRPPALVLLGAGLARDQHAERVHAAGLPVVRTQLDAVGAQPHDVLLRPAGDPRAREEVVAPKYRVLGAQREDPLREGEQLALACPELPRVPRRLVVVAIGVVVSALPTAQLVSVR